MVATARPHLTSVPRDRSVDLAKGAAMVMIVLGHVLRGLVAANELGADSPTYRILDRALYLIHVVVFAFLAGLFVGSGVQRRGSWRYLSLRLCTFLWLYLLWTLLQGGLKVLAASDVNTPIRWTDVARVWLPDGQLWFFPWMALATAVTVAVAPWRSRRRGVALLAATSAVSVATWGVDYSTAFLHGIQLTPFFVLGAWIGSPEYAALWGRRGRTVLVAVAGLAVWVAVSVLTDATAPTGEGFDRSGSTVAIGVVGAVAGGAGLLAACALVGHGHGRGLEWVGRRSLDVFLVHITVVAAVRVLLLRAGLHGLPVHLVLATFCGVWLSLLVAELARRARCRWLFELPAPVEAMLRAGPASGVLNRNTPSDGKLRGK